MIYIILGTKAQLIKMAPLMVALKERGIDYVYISTGQHKETMHELHQNFDIREPDLRLYNGEDITGVCQMALWSIRIITKILVNKRLLLKDNRRGIVLVHGDTFSTLLGALLGKLLRLKVAHIESGLRSFNIFHPFPEEITRILTFSLTDYYFCPGDWAVRNIEKYRGYKINTTMNTLYDSLRLAMENEDHIKIDIPDTPYSVATIHRYENIFHRDKLKRVVDIVLNISERVKVLFILHPPTRKNLEKFGLYEILHKNKNIELRPRYDYFEFIKLMQNSEFIISDGGSNQEESYYMGQPCLLLRKATERTEGLGENVVLSNYDDKILEEFIKKYKKYKTDPVMGPESPSKIIVDFLIDFQENRSLKTENLNEIEYTEEYYLKEFRRHEEKHAHFQDKVKNVMEMVMPISEKEVILDLGTCSGTFAFECAKYCATVYGVDLSRMAIAYCNKRKKELAVDNCEFMVCRSENIPFKDGYFDKIIMGDVAEHLPGEVFLKTISEVKRLLKPKGLLIIYTPNRSHLFEWLKEKRILKPDPTHINLMTKDQLEDILKSSGLAIQKSYYKSSHFLLFNLLEDIFTKIPLLDRFSGRRICIVGIK
ncbi:MAG: hypothetical protein A2132_01665 [Nitrospirae bacterium RBG_16_43_11]|nr:MAG: hypothetical protein A2132_01665 [Nitrospirae bacterium RBG_16_43_11]